jgi:Effector-associated domain 1
MASLNLNGQQSQMVEDALREAYPNEGDLAALVFHATNHRLNDLVAEQLAGKVRAFKLIEAVEANSLTTQLLERAVRDSKNAQLAAAVARVMPGVTPPEPSAYELANRSQFDLTDLEHAFQEAMWPKPGVKPRLVGFGVGYSDETFISLIRERLSPVVGRNTFGPDPSALNPKHTKPDDVIQRIAKLKDRLRTNPVLYVVRADQAEETWIAQLWQGVSASFPDPLDSFLIVIIAKDGAQAFPASVTLLPSPKFTYPHLQVWAKQLVKELRKANADWEPVDKWATLWSERLYKRSEDAGALNVYLVYDNLKADIDDLKRNESDFRLSLEKD